jgi:hypothetical protein
VVFLSTMRSTKDFRASITFKRKEVLLIAERHCAMLTNFAKFHFKIYYW